MYERSGRKGETFCHLPEELPIGSCQNHETYSGGIQMDKIMIQNAA